MSDDERGEVAYYDQPTCDLIVPPRLVASFSVMHRMRLESPQWCRLQTRDRSSVHTRNIIAMPGVIGTCAAFLASGTRAEVAQLTYYIGESETVDISWLSDLRLVAGELGGEIDLTNIVVSLPNGVCGSDPSSVGGPYIYERYPHPLWLTHDDDQPARHMTSELTKMSKGFYFRGCAKRRYKRRWTSLFIFQDKTDAAMAKMFFGGKW